MAKSKSIQDQITDLEERCKQLENLKKMFDKAVKNEFGYDCRKIHLIIEAYEKNDNI